MAASLKVPVIGGKSDNETVLPITETVISSDAIVPLQSTDQSVSVAPSLAACKKQYGRVVISLENPILSNEVVQNTPSLADGLDSQSENDLRITGCRLIQISGILLRLPQVAMATGQVLFQRYYYCKSFVRFPMEITAMACVVLASKVEEAPRRIRDILNVFHNMKQIRLGQPTIPMILDESYVNLKNHVIKSERRILKELGFCVHVKHPHKMIVTIIQSFGFDNYKQLIQASWSYMNDSLQTNVFVRYPPETIACACIHLSARIFRIPLPCDPMWYLVFNADPQAIDDICHTILQLYTRKVVPQEELETKVSALKIAFDESKQKLQKLRGAESNQGNSTPTADSFSSRTNSPKSVPRVNESKSLQEITVLKQHKITHITPNKLDAKDSSNSSTPTIRLEKSPIHLSKNEIERNDESLDERSSRHRNGSDQRLRDNEYSRYDRHHREEKHYESRHNYESRHQSSSSKSSRYLSSTIVTADCKYTSNRDRSRSRSPSYGYDRHGSRIYNSGRYSNSENGRTREDRHHGKSQSNRRQYY